jgi:hypothetical protein
MGKDPMTRRDFVRLGAGAVATSTLLKATILEPGPLFALDGPSGKIRFASIGTGVRGCELLKASLLVPNGECVAVSDLYDGRLRAAQEVLEQNVPSSHRTYGHGRKVTRLSDGRVTSGSSTWPSGKWTIHALRLWPPAHRCRPKCTKRLRVTTTPPITSPTSLIPSACARLPSRTKSLATLPQSQATWPITRSSKRPLPCGTVALERSRARSGERP